VSVAIPSFEEIMAENKDKPKQQRVIDHVDLTIGPDTPLVPQSPQDDGTCRVQIGASGYGSVLVWFSPTETYRVIEAILKASQLKPEPEPEPASIGE